VTATLVVGVLTGLSYGLLGLGVVLVYKTHRFISLAQGQLGTIAALLLAKLILEFGWSYWVAFPVALAGGATVGATAYLLVIRRVRRASPMAATLASLGIAQVLLALTFVKTVAPDPTALYLHGFPVPFEVQWSVLGYVLHGQDILIVVLVPALAIGLAGFLRGTGPGRAVRAVGSNAEEAELCGISTARVGATVWAIAGGLSALVAVIQAPGQGTVPLSAFGPTLLLRALGAAAAGGFVSLPAALVGGLGLGVLEHLTLYFTHSGGAAELVVVVAIALLCSRRASAAISRRTFTAEIADEPRSRVGAAPRRPWWQLPAALLAAGLLPLLPMFQTESRRFLLVLLVAYAIVSVSLTVLLGWAGQLSLGHFALLGIGAYLTARLEPHGWSMPALLLLSAALGGGVLVLVAVSATRARGAALAVTTLGLAVAAPAWLFRQAWFGGPSTLIVEPPTLAGLGHPADQLPIYLAAIVVLGAAIAALSRVRRAHPGRVVFAQRDNPEALASLGFAPLPARLGIVAVSGGLAAMAGVLWASAWHAVSTDLLSPAWSIQIIAAPVIGGLGSLGGAVVGTVVVFGPSLFFGTWFRSVFGNDIGVSLFAAGAGLIVTQLFAPGGLAALWHAAPARRGASIPGGELRVPATPKPRRATVTRPPPARAKVLTATDVTVHFDGLVALDNVSIEVGEGEIVALIGPNGAGKTSLLDVLSGITAPEGGRIELLGRDISHAPPHVRAAQGLGRSFQHARLFPGLTVTEVIMLGLSQSASVSFLGTLAGVPWLAHSERVTRERALVVIEEYGLGVWADTLIANLSTGTRRVCDLALQVAHSPSVLLLDEPAAGLASREAEALGPILHQVRQALGAPILIVEHDMALVRAVADRVYALAAGRVIAEGSPAVVLNDARVIEEYLGATPSKLPW